MNINPKLFFQFANSLGKALWTENVQSFPLFWLKREELLSLESTDLLN